MTQPLQSTLVDGRQMAYATAGQGDPIVLLHGNPTSSYLWRHVMGPLAHLGRVIAPDLIGMGQSEKLPAGNPDRYRFVEHRRFLEGLLEALDVRERVVLVGHDWGGALAFDWACRHAGAVRGLAYMETMVRPRSWAEESPEGQELFRALRSSKGEDMVLQDNVFIDTLLSAATAALDNADLDVYRQPFLEPGEGRRAMLTWPREIPFDGDPADVHQIMADYSSWLETTDIPKLCIAAEPGAIITGDTRRFCQGLPNQHMVVVPAGHFVPEDAPRAVARALRNWIGQLPAT